MRMMGLEPIRAYAHHPLKMACLPFHHIRMRICIWCLRAESNCRHTDFQSVALPTELPRQVVATPIGFEPTIFAVTGRHVNRYTTGPFDYFVSIPYFIFLVNTFLYFFINIFYFSEISCTSHFMHYGSIYRYGLVANSYLNVVLEPCPGYIT